MRNIHPTGEDYGRDYRHFNLGFDLYLSNPNRNNIMAHKSLCMDFQFAYKYTIKYLLTYCFYKHTTSPTPGSFLLYQQKNLFDFRPLVVV